MPMSPGTNSVLKNSAPWPRPFVKWAGGKTQLLPELMARVPANYSCYHEPFLGGGALFFKLCPEEAIISDINPDLVTMYQVVQQRVKDLIRQLKTHEHSREYFYHLREADRGTSYRRWGPVRKASRLIYLNKTCYNGLYRVNSKGEFNTPFGDYKNPRILDESNLLACSHSLEKTQILQESFDTILTRVKKGDFVYLDPPYAPLSATSSFTAYSREGFGTKEQERLKDVCDALDKMGVSFLLSNSNVPLIRKLYPHYRQEEVRATRAINSKASKRGAVTELMIRNY